MKRDTRLTHAGRDPSANHGIVNPPVYHASTVLFPTMEAWESRAQPVAYGRFGTPTQFALEEALSDLEGAHDTVLAPSGLAAITTTIAAFLEAGGHILVSDSAYRPVRKYCDGLLSRYGVTVEYYDPRLDGDGLDRLIRPETKLVWLESPGSMTFEVQNIPALAAAARARGVPTACDNTWAAGYYFRPLEHGVDVSVQAATKYIVGHSDAMMGAICANEETAGRIRETARQSGTCAAPDDVYLAQRGLRTLAARLARHQESGLKIARWLSERTEVRRVLHPGLPEHPDHVLWARDFDGASGLFGLVVDAPSREALARMIDGYALFGIGASWGGFESLIITGYPERTRTATAWSEPGQVLRLHIGLEDPDDLIADLEAGFERLAAG